VYKDYLADPHVQAREKEWLQRIIEQPIVIDIRALSHHFPFKNARNEPARQVCWMKANGKLGDDPRIHQCVVAYASDHRLLTTPLLPHNLHYKDPRVSIMASLDHSMWFYEPFRADEWLLYELEVSCFFDFFPKA